MAKIKLNPLILRMQGKIGNAVLRLCHTGDLQFVTAPDMSRVKWSQAQQEHRSRFREAVAYARAAMKDPQIKAYYLELAAQRNKRPFDMAVSDYFKGDDTGNRLLKMFRLPQGDAGGFVKTERSRTLPAKPAAPQIPADDYCI